MNIIFNCEYGTKAWTPHTFSGGSEEQTILLAELFASAGHHVVIRNHSTKLQTINGVLYISVGDPIALMPTGYPISRNYYDIYFGWRDYRLFSRRYAPLQILLCHDVPNYPHFPSMKEISAGALRNIDYVHVLNQHHYDLYLLAGCPREKLRIIPIIIEPNPWLGQVERDRYKCIWHCQPNRGLPQLLSVWPQIKRAVPEATLQVCWWNEADKDGLPHTSTRLGILPIKYCTHDQLNRELASSYLFPYCSVFNSEISPASCLKAQNSGVYPVVVAKGGMRCTMGDTGASYCDDLGFTPAVIDHLKYGIDAYSQFEKMYDLNLYKHRPGYVLDAWYEVIGTK